MKRVIVLAAVASLGLAGCATHKKPQTMEVSSYDQGYHDGCESGIWYDLSKIKKKDYHRAMSDRGYFYGWDEGFTECRYNIYRKKV